MLVTPEEVAAWERLVNQVSFRGGLKMKLKVDPDDYGIAVRISLTTKDVLTNLPTEIRLVNYVPHEMIHHYPESCVRWLYNLAKQILLHELDESFCVGGKQLHDPHAKDRRGDNS